MGATEYNLPQRVLEDITVFAQKYNVDKIILFGSRAKGTHRERSDIDIAVLGGDFDGFYWDIKENAWTLLMFDIIDLSERISEELRQEIEKYGVTIYEKLDNFVSCLAVCKKRILTWQEKMKYIGQGYLVSLI